MCVNTKILNHDIHHISYILYVTLPEEGLVIWSRVKNSRQQMWEAFHLFHISPFPLVSGFISTPSLLYQTVALSHTTRQECSECAMFLVSWYENTEKDCERLVLMVVYTMMIMMIILLVQGVAAKRLFCTFSAQKSNHTAANMFLRDPHFLYTNGFFTELLSATFSKSEL